MNIRPATASDIPAIITLLKESLGESMIPKSEQLWNWKHNENPFGPSYVLVAEENDVLIGVRAFMQWQWTGLGKTYNTVRAVDTATHPAHQGRGIFKQLTLAQLDLCKTAGTHFVFNTPNEKSRPGYLKMGWQPQGKMPMKLCVRRPFSVFWNRLTNKVKYKSISTDPTPKADWNNVTELLSSFSLHSDKLHSAYNSAYIQWRYANNPLFNYTYFTDNNSYILVGRVKYQSFIKELRLTDFFLLNDTDKKNTRRHIKQSLRKFCKAHSIDFISMSGNQYLHYKDLLPLGLIPVRRFGPIVTIKDINVTNEMPALLNIDNWEYSLGDMELF